MSKGYEYVKNSRHNLKRRLLYVMGDKCCICGYNNCSSALEFHHIDPTQKDFSISSNANIAFESAILEIKKTILVCANCHREIHEGLIENIGQYQSFDELKYKEIQKELLDLRTKTIYYCKDCGKIISTKAERCPECANINSRKVERPTREELKQLIKEKPFTQIANLYGVTDNAIRKWCDAEHLPRTKKIINSYSEEEWQKI